MVRAEGREGGAGDHVLAVGGSGKQVSNHTIPREHVFRLEAVEDHSIEQGHLSDTRQPDLATHQSSGRGREDGG